MKNTIPKTKDLLNLTGKHALVTGAGGDIGQVIARRLAEADASVIVHYMTSQDSADALVQLIIKDGGDAQSIQADLTVEKDVEGLFQILDGKNLRPDIVVNNAAQQPVVSLADMGLAAWQQMFAANLDSVFLVSQTAARFMRGNNVQGAIVNIASIEGLDPAEGHAHYATSKAGLLMFTRASALEFGSDGIRVNAVSPGLIHRQGLEVAWPEGVSRWQANAPLSLLGQPEDVADAVLFLASPAARWITGVNLVVDGGMSVSQRW